ncbi:hypothetical protein ACFLXY_06600 [Chloroflexota bacterium]
MGNTEMVTTNLPNIHNTSKKVAKFLIDSALENNSGSQITISKIAQLLDMTPYAVNESLLWLQDKDVMQLQRGRITFRNMGRINEIAA